MQIKDTFKIVLVGDTHPEMLYIAQRYAITELQYRVFLPFYLTAQESQFLSKLLPRNSKYQTWLRKRTLSSEIHNRNLKRPFASLDLFLWFFKKWGFEKIPNLLLKIYKFLLRVYLTFYLQFYRPNKIVCYDTVYFHKPLKSKLIVICPLAHPASVIQVLEKARKIFPSWPNETVSDSQTVQKTINKADKIIVFSEYAKNTYLSNGFQSGKIDVMHIGPINYSPKLSLNGNYSATNFDRVLFLGQITLRKGIPAIIEAAQLLEKSFTFYIAGPIKFDVLRYLNENKPVNVEIIPNPHPDTLGTIFNQSDIFLMPSYSEGFSIACLEAMTYGLIPILSKNTGVAELLKGLVWENFIIEPGSSAHIVRALHHISGMSRTDCERYSKMSEKVVENLSMESFADLFFQNEMTYKS